MRISVKLTLDCDPHAAWRALHSPAVVAELYGPLLRLDPMEKALPLTLDHGDDIPVRMRMAGVAIGEQLIHVTDRRTEDAHGPVRILRDSGIPLTGPLSSLEVWDHQMAVAPDPADPSKTLWRERLIVRGRTAPLLWPLLWTIWQWRSARLRALAPTWAHDPEIAVAEDHRPA